MASKQLYEFLDVLVADKTKRDRFNKGGADAQAVMTAEGLDAQDQQLLKTGTNHEIREQLKDELRTRANAYVIRMA